MFIENERIFVAPLWNVSIFIRQPFKWIVKTATETAMKIDHTDGR